MKVYFCRHGETIGNRDRILMGGLMDFALTEKGEKQALNLREKLHDIEFDKVFVSPNQRAIDTLKICFGNTEFEIDERLREQSFGEMTGVCVDDIPESIDNEWRSDPFSHKHVNGESFEELIVRVSGFLDDLKQMEFESVMVMTHCNVMRAVEAYFGVDDREAMFLKIENCGVNIYEF